MTNILVDLLNELSKPAPPPTPWEKFKDKVFGWALAAVWVFGWIALIILVS